MATKSIDRKSVHAAGFTLVEIAIVVVIVAFLFLGVIKGQALVTGAKAKDVIAIVADLRNTCSLFRERYKYLPGDWPFTSGEIAGLASGTTVGTNGNGAIEGSIVSKGGRVDAAESGSEVAELPLQLFQAGLIGKMNATDAQRRITTSFGTVHVVSKATAEGLVAGFSASNPSVRNAVIISNVPCDIAAEVDASMDDASLTTGRVIGTNCVSGVVQWLAAPL